MRDETGADRRVVLDLECVDTTRSASGLGNKANSTLILCSFIDSSQAVDPQFGNASVTDADAYY